MNILNSSSLSAEDIYRKLVFTKKNNLSTEEWMEKDWDNRAQENIKFFVRSVYGQTEEEFWKSGEENCKEIVGVNSSRYNQIIGNKNPKEMRVLEIGCGIGRILIPMSKVFGEAIGVDISEKIIQIAKDFVEKIPNCRVFKGNGTDLSIFSDNNFDFCYSYIVFQHIPDKKIIVNYMREVSRVLKSGGLFRFQVFGDTKWKPSEYNTWMGIHFTSQEIHQIAKENKFEILEESGQHTQYYWLTFKSK